MNKTIPFFLLMLFFLGCHDAVDNEKSNSKIKQNNLRLLLDSCKNKNLDLAQRMLIVNRAIHTFGSDSLDSLQLSFFAEKAHLLYKLKNNDSMLFYDALLLKLAERYKNDFFAAKGHFNVAVNFREKQQNDSAFYHHNASKNYYLKLGDSIKVGRRLLSMASIQNHQSDFFGSKETATEALGYLVPKKDETYIASTYNIIASDHRKLLNYEDAIRYSILAIETTPNEIHKSTYKNNLAIIYIDIKDYLSATDWLLKAKKILESNKNSSRYVRVIDNLAYTKWLKNDYNSEVELLEALQIRETIKDIWGSIASHAHLAEFYFDKNKSKSKYHILKGIEASKQNGSIQGEIEAYKRYVNLEPKNTKIANYYLSLRDSAYNMQLRTKTQFAKLKYDDKLKQEAILRLENEKQFQLAELIKQKNQKLLISIGASALLMVGVLIFFLFKQLHKKEKIKEAYITETRVSKKIHDELANDVFGIISGIQSNPELNMEKLIDKLEGVYNRTRDISRETASINIQIPFHEGLKEALGYYSHNGISITIKGLAGSLWDNVEDHKRITIYRVLNELMVNMKKHSKASMVVLSFERKNNRIYINYIDNGIGLVSQDLNKGNGLANVESRINNIQGTFTFIENYKKGLKLEIKFPT